MLSMLKTRRGVTASSYGLVVGLIAVVAIGVVTSTGSSINSLFTDTSDTLESVTEDTVGQTAAAPSPEASPVPSPDGFAFVDATGQSLGAQVLSNTATLSGGFPSSTVSISGDGSPEFSVNGDTFSNTPRAISSGQTLQLRLTTTTNSNDTLTATVEVAGHAVDWSVTTGNFVGNLVPGNTTAIASRDGFQVTCQNWNGNVCRSPRVNPVNASWLNSAATHGGTPDPDEFMGIWWGDTNDRAEMFCYWATGNANTVSVSTLSQGGYGDNPTQSMLGNYTGCSGNTNYQPCYLGTYTISSTTYNLTFMRDTTNNSVTMECSGW
ncbi:MAG: hypothetical protein Alpg2KO_28020 [Alphaproteobacteria bacterium]